MRQNTKRQLFLEQNTIMICTVWNTYKPENECLKIPQTYVPQGGFAEYKGPQ